MNAEYEAAIADVASEMRNILSDYTYPIQVEAIKVAAELALVSAKPNPNEAGDFWTVFLELFKMLLPLILELLKG